MQTSKSQLCRSPNVADTSLVSTPISPPPLGAAEVNTIRIIGQYLKNLGLQYVVKHAFHFSYVIRYYLYLCFIDRFCCQIGNLRETVATLFAESGCRLEDTLAVRLREYIMAGEWDHALGIVDKMSPFVANLNLLRIREKLYEEKFVDLLGKERVTFDTNSKFIFGYFLTNTLRNYFIL